MAGAMPGWAGVNFRAARASGMAVPRLPRPAKIGRDGGGPDLSVLGGMGEIGAGGSLEKSGPDLPRTGSAKRYRGAKKKNIYFWLTAGLIARTCLESLAITNLIQPFTYGASAPLLRATRPCVE